MGNATVPVQKSEYFIVGPTVQPDNGVLEAIYALYYLPLRYSLILPVNPPEDTAFYRKIVAVVQANALEGRIHFVETRTPQRTTYSPEAFASAMLAAVRSRQRAAAPDPAENP